MGSVVETRRALHRIPEVGFSLPETAAYVEAALRRLPCRVFSPVSGSVCAFFDAGRPETAAFRADMDALPLTERTGLPYASGHPGVMHACGHDGHTALMLALAECAAEALPRLPRNALFLFQPAEESPGGAEPLCRTGVLEEVRAARVFGLHIWPGLPAGTVWSRPGPLMARASEVDAVITGKSAHISQYRQGKDALAAGCEYLRRVSAWMDGLSAEETALLRFGKMRSGTVRNALSGETVLEGSLRTYSEAVFRRCAESLRALGAEVAAETGCTADIRLSEGYPAVRNPETFYHAVCAQLGENAPCLLPEPVLASEDFSFYQQRVPGVFFFLGAGDTPPLHSQDYTFDDETVLPAGLAFLRRLLMLA